MALYFFTPRYIKEARALHGAAHKIYHYRKDLLPEAEQKEFSASLRTLSRAIEKGGEENVRTCMKPVEELASKIAPPEKHSGWRENCEVLLVAIVIAAGVRAFVVQPFKIPTGSMQPTLNGIIAAPQPAAQPFPNPVIRFLEFYILGRNYVDVVSKYNDDAVVSVSEKTYLNFFTFTEIRTEKGKYSAFAPIDQIRQSFGVVPGRRFNEGDLIARGIIETGDQVFVDKISYHFAPPVHGDVFVFKTTGIRRIQANLPPGVDSQHYIKRLAGMPGQTLRIIPPWLYINGRIASNPMLRRVMSCANGYAGYSNTMAFGRQAFTYLGSPRATFTVPRRTYFALGDNSFHSSDSRAWGPVPEENVAGRAVLVYWPISSRWGFIQ